jgi:hypothetical protein
MTIEDRRRREACKQIPLRFEVHFKIMIGATYTSVPKPSLHYVNVNPRLDEMNGCSVPDAVSAEFLGPQGPR